MTAPAVRPLLSIAAASLALGSLGLAGAPTAFAAPGDNGDIKIHHAGGRDEPRRTAVNSETTEPRVCTFYLAAFDFEGLEQLSWTISPQRPVDSVTTNGTITIDSTGRGITPDLTLVDGAYRVEWTWESQTGTRKSRDFRVDCDEITNTSANGGSGSNGSSADGGSSDRANATNGNANGGSGSGNSGNSGSGSSDSGSDSGNNSGSSGSGNSWSGSGSGGNDGSGGSGGSGGGGGGGGRENGSEGGWSGGDGGKPPQGPVGAGGGGSATTTTTESSDDGSMFGVAAALAAGLAGTAGLILVRRARRRTHGAS
ncbi:hypothetical protein [Streptomyces sp. NPDC013457]|uniref:hypothetical protein n=1 Tax=Streptomyces sp. NPDC013457 TaxID=3364866 RepID=UPI0037012B41